MGQIKNNQRGIGTVEAVLLLLIVAIIGATGWYVWQSNKQASDNLKSSAGTVKFVHKKKATATTDPTADWQSFSSPAGKFSVKYPKTWVQPANQKSCNATMLANGLYLGPDSASVLKCGSDDGFGQISIDSNKENNSGFDFSSGYTNVVKKSVTVAGVTGERISAVSSGQQQLLGSLPNGTIVVEYSFNTNGKFYVAHYIQQSGFADVLTDYDLMITKTLKFE